MNTSDSQSPPSKNLALATIGGVTAVQVIATMGILIPAAIAPELARTLDLPVSMIGFQVSLAYVGATLMSLCGGLVQRKLGAVRANQVAATAIGFSLLIIAIPHVAALFVGSLGLGIAYGMTNPAASHLMMKIASPSNRNLIFSVKQTGQPLGGVIAGLMAPPIAIAFGWQWSLMAGAFLALSTVLLIQPLRAKLDGDRDPTTKFRGAVFKDVNLVLRIRELRLLALAALTFSGVQLALMTFAVTMLVEDVKFDLVLAGVGLAVIQIAGVVGRLGWGVIADRNGDGRKTLLFAQSLSVVAAVATAFLSDSMPLVAVFGILFLFGVSAVGWNGVFMAEIGRLAPEGKIGSATGGVLVPTFIGVMMGPLVFSAIHETTATYTMSFAVLALVTMMGMVPILMMRGSRQKE